MDARKAGAGLALGGVGYALWVPNTLAFSMVSTAVTTVQALTLLGAGAALAALAGHDRPGARGALAGLLVVGAAASVGDVATSLGGQITILNPALAALGWVLLAWYAVLWSVEGGAAARIAGMRIGVLSIVVGHLLWIPYNIVDNSYIWMPGNVVGSLGLFWGAQALRPTVGRRAAAREQEPQPPPAEPGTEPA